MNEKELIKSYIATCKCCLLAQAMKDCPTCYFNLGLAEQARSAESLPLPVQIQIVAYAMAE
jgi:hypothetical protein